MMKSRSLVSQSVSMLAWYDISDHRDLDSNNTRAELLLKCVVLSNISSVGNVPYT